MNKTIGIMLLSGMCVINAWAAPKQLSANEVSASNLKIIIGEKYGTSIDKEGTLIVQQGQAQKIVVIINQEEKLVIFWNAWLAKPSASKEKCMQMTNDWIKDQSFFAVTYDDSNKRFIRCYAMSFQNGVIAENLLVMLERYLADDEKFVRHFYEAGVLK